MLKKKNVHGSIITNINPSKDELIIVRGRGVTRRQILDAISIDSHYYPDHAQVDVDTAIRWLTRNPEIYTMLVNSADGHSVGYANLMPLESDWFEMMKDGRIKDNSILPEAIMNFSFDRTTVHNMYFSSIAMHPLFRSPANFFKLFSGLVENMVSMHSAGVLFGGIVADVFTSEGERLAKNMGLELINITPHKTKIYYADEKWFQPILKKYLHSI